MDLDRTIQVKALKKRLDRYVPYQTPDLIGARGEN